MKDPRGPGLQEVARWVDHARGRSITVRVVLDRAPGSSEARDRTMTTATFRVDEAYADEQVAWLGDAAGDAGVEVRLSGGGPVSVEERGRGLVVTERLVAGYELRTELWLDPADEFH